MKFEFVDENEKGKYSAKIKVIGVGGAGGNAINNMIASNLKGVDFIVANTDRQALERSACSFKIQLGPSITMGLGAGADPDIGNQAAEESITEIRESLGRPDMVSISAGMGGGTGTGACPAIARECKGSGALTVAVVTKPFKFEGEKRMRRAMLGIERLKEEVDSLIIIPNERLKTLNTSNLTARDLFSRADEVLQQAVRGISDLMLSSGFINLDFADVKKVMGQMGTAIIGMGRASGENRTSEAAQMAINSPLLEDISINGAKGLLMNIVGSSDMTMDEIDAASSFIKDQVNEDAEIFWGVAFDDAIKDEVQVTIIATGIEDTADIYEKSRKNRHNNDSDTSYAGTERNNVVNLRDLSREEAEENWAVRLNGINLDPDALDTPTFQRQNLGLSSMRNDNNY
ncbi:MAG TPA: cell division protein FtsZ, partial [Desulfobacteraceae bacterium]|nr:cell division protein FtsZ [Desulfobacteraceae bacterium]